MCPNDNNNYYAEKRKRSLVDVRRRRRCVLECWWSSWRASGHFSIPSTDEEADEKGRRASDNVRISTVSYKIKLSSRLAAVAVKHDRTNTHVRETTENNTKITAIYTLRTAEIVPRVRKRRSIIIINIVHVAVVACSRVERGADFSRRSLMYLMYYGLK